MEQFKDTSYPGYTVSDHGRIFTKERTIKANKYGGIRTIEAKEKAPSDNGGGYKFVTLHYDGEQKRAYVHRLVAEAFVPNPEGKPTVNHKDGDKSNNLSTNLEWATYKEQSDHSDSTGLSNKGVKRREVYQYDKNGTFLASYPSVSKASEKTGVNRQGISECVKPFRNQGKTAGGYIWCYPGDEDKVFERVKNKPGEEVHQYSLEGEFLNKFDQVKDAVAFTEIGSELIRQCLREDSKTAGGYIWIRPKGSKEDREEVKRKMVRPDNKVYQYTLEGQFLREYSSVKEAAYWVGLKGPTIHQAIKRAGTAGGYIWKRSRDYQKGLQFYLFG